MIGMLRGNNAVRRLPVLWTWMSTVLRDVFIVAFGVHVVVVLTHATCERRIDAKASPDNAVVVSKLTDVSMKIQLQIMVG